MLHICKKITLKHVSIINYELLNIQDCSFSIPDSKVHGANMGPIWGRLDPGGPHVGPMNFAICDALIKVGRIQSPVVNCRYWIVPNIHQNFRL